MAGSREERGVGIDGYLFRLIATFEAAAMQQLGKIAHPVTGDVEVSLEGARDSIEMLAMIQRKTEGNLNDDEGRLLQHVLYQLRMNYVDVSRAEEQSSEGPEPAEGGGPAEAAGERGPSGDEAEGGAGESQGGSKPGDGPPTEGKGDDDR
jgi:hypothetical protein